jgi:glycine dehydrogenase subunit 1
MLEDIGINGIDKLFEAIPDSNKTKSKIGFEPKSEKELIDYFKRLSEENRYPSYKRFLGAGAYEHLIPEVVNYISGKGEFVTPYTPYQPEVAQGTLQATFEYQTMMANLTGMEFSNASLYDGATAAAEGILLAWRVTRKNRFLIAKSIHPEYLQTIQTYVKNLGITIETIDWDESGRVSKKDFEKKYDENIGGILIQSPNFFGIIEDYSWIKEKIGENKTLLITAVAEALSLGILKPPSFYGADVVVGEAQSFGLYPSYGGPTLGFITTSNKKFLWELPGRIVGETVDTDGNTGYVLTLSTREQHIRRERATSNICSNQAWCIIRASVFLSVYGKRGIKELAYQNIQKANYAKEQIQKKGIKIKFDSPVFNEFVIEVEDSEKVYNTLLEKKIVCGIPLKWFFPEDTKSILITFTEVISKEEIDLLIKELEKTK